MYNMSSDEIKKLLKENLKIEIEVDESCNFNTRGQDAVEIKFKIIYEDDVISEVSLLKDHVGFFRRKKKK